MKFVTKLLVLVLALLMCVGCFASCGGDDTTTTTTTTTNPGGDVTDPGDGYVNKLLNDKTYDGKTCTIWYKNNSGPGNSLWIEEPGVSALDRASFNRLQTIKERTGVTVEGIKSAYTDDATFWTESISYLRDLFSADDAENIPDIVMPGGYATSVLAGEGWFLDLSVDNPYIDLSMDCWDQQMNDELSICGTYYGVSGLFTISNVQCTFCIYFDKDALSMIDLTTLEGTAAADFEDSDTLYQWARDGEWTYKKLLALAAAFAGENGSIQVPGQETVGDKYGLEYQGTSSYSIFMATGKKYVAPNYDNYGIPELMVDEPETLAVLNWLVDNVSTKPYVHDWGGDNGSTGLGERMGLSHDSLFAVGHVSAMVKYSSLGAETVGTTGSFNYGALPMPKFDYENAPQENYCGAMNAWWMTLACIPENAADTDFSSFVLQLITEMGYYAWEEDVTTIWDAYIIDGMYGRYAPDVQDEEMLDIILDSMTADLGEVNMFGGINIGNSIRDLYRKGGKTWATWAQSNRGTINFAIQEMLVAMGLISYT